ncbi:MAG: hypothetical protein M3Z05_18775 [Gemmatimonadota bacterium]|nr:hypothetical protein [Gemmatimonadota bacterium]
MSSTKPPPRTRSGEMTAVKDFYKELKIFEEETAPQLDKALEKMDELKKKVTITPDTEPEPEPAPAIPKPPRSPSFVDEEERKAAAEKETP